MLLNFKNTQIYYTDKGQGSPLVLLHGLLECSAMWNALINDLHPSYRIITIDLLGHGKSACLHEEQTIEDMAEAVKAVLDHLNIFKAHVVGHSMGGYVALALAEIVPELFTSFVLLNSTFKSDTEERKAQRLQTITLAQLAYHKLVRAAFKNLFAINSKHLNSAVYKEQLALALKTPQKGFIAAQYAMMKRPDRFEVLKQLSCKKAIITGRKDPLIDSASLLEHIKGTEIAGLEFNAGHMAHIENEKELSYFINHFIDF